MIDISHKRSSLRYARATGTLLASPEIIESVRDGRIPKGDVRSVARSAGIQAAKRASEWIVFCHAMPVDWVEVSMELEEDRMVFTAEVRSVWKTGMEMEAMTAVSAALLNAYDMLKPLKENVSIGEIRLVEKTGGKSDMSDRFEEPLKAAVVVVSSAKKQGRRADRAGDVIREFLADQPVTVAEDIYVEEHPGQLAETLKKLAKGWPAREEDKSDTQDADENAESGMDLVFVCGATGPTINDITPQVIRDVSDKLVPGMGEAMRSYGYQRTPFAMFSEQIAGLRGQTLMVALPGSARGARESMNALFPGVLHIFRMLRGKPGAK